MGPGQTGDKLSLPAELFWEGEALSVFRAPSNW